MPEAALRRDDVRWGHGGGDAVDHAGGEGDVGVDPVGEVGVPA